MATGIIFTIIVIISILAIKSYAKKVMYGCCGKAKNLDTVGIRKSINKEEYPYCKEILIYGMTCAYCKKRIENEFNQREGDYIEVDLKKNRALLYTLRPIVKEDVIERFRSLGYHVLRIKDSF